jgi:hypothetical protein
MEQIGLFAPTSFHIFSFEDSESVFKDLLLDANSEVIFHILVQHYIFFI